MSPWPGNLNHLAPQPPLFLAIAIHSFADKPTLDLLYTKPEMETHVVASYYRLTSLSHAAIYHAIMRDKLLQRKFGLPDCEAFALMFHDHVHPDALGEHSTKHGGAWHYTALHCTA